MKKILAGSILVFGLSFLSLGNIGFAQCNPACDSDQRCCEKTDRCMSIKEYNTTCINTVSKSSKEECEKQEQMVRKNGACVNDIAGDTKANIEQCKKSCKGSESCMCKCEGGIALNTNIPFIGRCISKDGNTADGNSAIAGISSALTQIFMTLIITGGFAMVIRGGVQIAMGQNKDGMAKIKNVVIAFAALGSLGIILRLINPNFFK